MYCGQNGITHVLYHDEVRQRILQLYRWHDPAVQSVAVQQEFPQHFEEYKAGTRKIEAALINIHFLGQCCSHDSCRDRICAQLSSSVHRIHHH